MILGFPLGGGKSGIFSFFESEFELLQKAK